MHETSIARNVIRIVEEAAQKNDLACVSKVVLEIGQFSGVEIGALEFAFSALKHGTILQDATIEYLTPPLTLFCRECENEYLGDFDDLRCPACMGTHFEVIHGREMIVKSIIGVSNGQ